MRLTGTAAETLSTGLVAERLRSDRPQGPNDLASPRMSSCMAQSLVLDERRRSQTLPNLGFTAEHAAANPRISSRLAGRFLASPGLVGRCDCPPSFMSRHISGLKSGAHLSAEALEQAPSKVKDLVWKGMSLGPVHQLPEYARP